MKQLVCEMCGGNDLVKQDGAFVCQHCGAKYSVEEAKKMMIEGTVDVTGSTVKVDNADKLSNLYVVARRARDDNNVENAAKYYDMILVEDPTSWEAAFYTVYYQALSCRIINIESAAYSIKNCLENVFKLIHDNVPEDEQATAVGDIVAHSIIAAKTLSSSAWNHYKEFASGNDNSYARECYGRMTAAKDIMFTCRDMIENTFDENSDMTTHAGLALMSGIELYKAILPIAGNQTDTRMKIAAYIAETKKYNTSYFSGEKKIVENELSELKKKLAGIQQKGLDAGWLYLCSIASIVIAVLLVIFTEVADTISGVFALILLVAGYGLWQSAKIKDSDDNKAKSLRAQIAAKEKELGELEK